jgi:hypothetical protein
MSPYFARIKVQRFLGVVYGQINSPVASEHWMIGAGGEKSVLYFTRSLCMASHLVHRDCARWDEEAIQNRAAASWTLA